MKTIELTDQEVVIVLNALASKKVDCEYRMQDTPKTKKLFIHELSTIEQKLSTIDSRVRFQIIEKTDSGNEVHLNELKTSDRVTLSINAMFEALQSLGKVVFLQKWLPGDKEATIIARSWVK